MEDNRIWQDGVLSNLAAQKRLIVLSSSSICKLSGLRTKLQKQQQIDYFDNGFMQSKLSMEEYLSFYGIANGVYSSRYRKKMLAYMEKYKLSNYYEVPICNLKLREQLLVRFFITQHKAVKTVMIDNTNGEIRNEDLLGVLQSMRRSARRIKCNCVIITVGMPRIANYEGEMYQL